MNSGRKKRGVDGKLLQLHKDKSSSSDGQQMEDEEQSNNHRPLKVTQLANENGRTPSFQRDGWKPDWEVSGHF